MKKLLVIFVFATVVLAGLLLESCRKTNSFSQTSLVLDVPTGWPQPQNVFAGNTPTEAGFQLGKKLFYDGRLSIDGNFACSSCHQRNAGFGTYNHDRSHGYNNSHTLRNAPGLFNLAWMKEFNWNGEYADLPSRAYAHIIDPQEMAANFPTIISRLNQDSNYTRMFIEAFGPPVSPQVITAERITKALAQFTGMLVSANSKYDRVKKGVENFTINEEAGYTIFKSKCAGCHKEPLFTDYSYRNSGFAIDPFLNDFGRMTVTHNRADSLKFRVPTLRNTSFTFPYMHDGRIADLPNVIDHYSTGVINSSTTDTSLLNKPPITAIEKVRLVQFLWTLNDSSFLENPRYNK